MGLREKVFLCAISLILISFLASCDMIVKWPKNTGQSKININLLSHERNTKEIQFSL